jgi:hypothetical protein
MLKSQWLLRHNIRTTLANKPLKIPSGKASSSLVGRKRHSIHLSSKQESSWPERFTSIELRADKKAAIRRNKLSIFAREMECRLVSRETASFRPTWLLIRDYEKPRGCFSVLGIDPGPATL